MITLRPKPLKRSPTRPRRSPRLPMTAADWNKCEAYFQPLLSKFPSLDLSWSPDVQAEWFRTYAALKRHAEKSDTQP